MIITCGNCEFEYETEDHEDCPACGDDNEELIEEMEE